MYIFSTTDVTGAVSGYPHVRVYDAHGRLKGYGGTPVSGVTSVGLAVPTPVNPAFTVSGSPVTSSGVLTIVANGTASDYIDGTGALQIFPTIPSAQGLQDVIITDPNLTQNNTINGGNFNLKFSNNNRFQVETDQFASLTSDNGVTNVASVEVNTVGVQPFVDIQAKNGTDTIGLTVDTSAIFFRTPVIDAGTGAIGYVLTLIDPLSGEADFQPATGGGGSGTVTSVQLSAGTGISLSGTNPITTSGTITVTNSAPDQTVVLTQGGTTTITGTYPNFTISSADQYVGTVTSVGLSMPAAFTVTNSPVTSLGTLTVTGAGLVTQYIRGDGSLGNFPTNVGGGSSVSYYLNGSVNQGTFVGNTYYEMSKIANTGAAANFTINADGYIAQFITSAGDPALLNIPAGNWDFQVYFSASSNGGTPQWYPELYKYDGASFTLVATGSASPETITGGVTPDVYILTLSVPATTLTLTDRLAIRIYIIHDSKTITMYTQGTRLAEVHTTFSTGLAALNGLTAQVQNFAVGTTGTDFNISSLTATHTFNLPTASATNRGALSSTDWSTFNGKQDAVTLTTTGSSGSSTFISNTLNVPTYTLTGLGGVPTSRTLTINGTAYDLSADRSWTIAAGISGSGTTNELAYFTASTTLASLTTATYPSLTELSYVKGLTSSAQTQLTNLKTVTIGATIDGSGGTITVGQKGYVQVPYACTITSWRLIANASGSIVVDIWKTASPTIPTAANVITASAKPTLSSQQTATSSTLTGWTTSVAANDIIGFNVNSATTVSWVILQIFVTKT